MGEEGKQKEELHRMVSWMAEHLQPDVIHLSNALLLGLAPKLREEFPNAVIVCSLQDEDVWVDAMNDSFRNKIWKLMSEKSHSVDGFIAVSDFYANVSLEKMDIPENKVFINHLGVEPEEYRVKAFEEKKRNIGYISRMCEANGFDIIIDAFIQLKQDQEFEDVRLILTGGSTGDDKDILKESEKKLKNAKIWNQVEFHEDFDGSGRHDFFDKVQLISVPVRNGEAFGLYLLESMASGVPVVQPKLGAFPEIVEKSKGGITFDQNTKEDLCAALKSLLKDQEKLKQLSKNSREGVENEFNITGQTENLLNIYNQLNRK
jgi:glycosyltransferase involved in cell wall biosynthesis